MTKRFRSASVLSYFPTEKNKTKRGILVVKNEGESFIADVAYSKAGTGKKKKKCLRCTEFSRGGLVKYGIAYKRGKAK